MTPEVSTEHKRRRTHVRHPWYVRYWPLGLVLVLAVVGGLWLRSFLISAGKRTRSLPGYIDQVSTLEDEYARFHGSALKDPDVRGQFANAAGLASRGEYTGALLLLESVVKKAPVPVVFNDMGLLYAQLDDRAHALRAFRDALARDFDYAPVRRNLDRLRGFTSNSADPVSTELEPNNNIQNANVIALEKPVDAEISQLDNDVDVYKMTSPPAPRDLIVIHVENHSKTLSPRLHLYDEEGVILPLSRESDVPGSSLTLYLAPNPNTTMYINISGYGSTSGPYTLSVKQLKAFDSFEPNDNIYSAKPITPGQPIDANIMDADDTDYYSFVAGRSGEIAVDITNASSTLIPALTCYGSDKSIIGFGPDIRTPGAPLHHTLRVQEGSTYYVQVWSQGRSSGSYTLKIQ